MVNFLRWVGLVNVAIWLGGCVFFTVAAAPAMFQPAIKAAFHDYYIGVFAQFMQERYFLFQSLCGGIAFGQALLCRLVCPRQVAHAPPWLLALLAAIGLAGLLWFTPHLRALHELRHRAPEPARREQARQTFRHWHACAQGLNLLGLAVLAWVFRRAAGPPAPGRPATANPFWGVDKPPPMSN